MFLTYILDIELSEHRIIQLGKYLMKFLVHLAASAEFRAAYSDLLNSAHTTSSQVSKITVALGYFTANCSTILLSCWEFSLHLTQNGCFLFQHMSNICLLSFHHTWVWRAWVLFLAGTGDLMFGSPPHPPLLQAEQSIMLLWQGKWFNHSSRT